MKILFLFLAFQIITPTIYAQTASPESNYYLKRSRRQKTTGIIFLSLGTISIIAGALVAASKANQSSPHGRNFGTAILIVQGVTVNLFSIPFFVASSRNRKKAARALLKTDSDEYLKKRPAF